MPWKGIGVAIAIIVASLIVLGRASVRTAIARRGTSHSSAETGLGAILHRGTEGSNPPPSSGEMVWGRRRGNGTIVAVAN